MNTYIYSQWLNSPLGYPSEFFSEIDELRNELRKVEIFEDKQFGYASKFESTKNTKLSIIPIPSLKEIQAQQEFVTKEISQQEFEDKWKEATQSHLR